MHRHHIIPKHAGGDDSELNLTPPISLRMHAMFHYDRWKQLGEWQDFIAYKCLLGRMNSEQARIEAARLGRDSSEKYKNRKKPGPFHDYFGNIMGGLAAAPALVEWQEQNREIFIRQCSINGSKHKGQPWAAYRSRNGMGGGGKGHSEETKKRISESMTKLRAKQRIEREIQKLEGKK